MKAEIKYFTDDYTTHTEQFATYDAVANISSLLTEKGFMYGKQKDVWLEEVMYEKSGRQVLIFRFSNPRDAMIERLRGM
tara:strand:+ start:2632 stop:2868 length:237 start_codon:yes stop_codon:yes gene_type:complete